MNFTLIAVIVAVIALLFAAVLSSLVSKESAGNDKMKEIASSIREGAIAFLTAEYKILVVVIVVLAILIFLGTNTPTAPGFQSALCFIVGAVFSICAG